PGRQADGSVLLPNQWSLRPVGTQVELGDCPVNIAVHPGGSYAAVLHAGYSQHEIMVVDLSRQQVVSRTPLHETFYGIQFSEDGRHLYCSGASDEVVHDFSFADGRLSHHRQIRLRDSRECGVPTGLAVDQKRRCLFAANLWAQTVSRVDPDDDSKVTDIPLTTNAAAQVSPAAAASPDFDTAAASKRQKAALFRSSPDDPLPYACVVDEKRGRLYVSLWAQSSVAVIDLDSNQVRECWSTQEHPCEMALTKSGQFLFVANANRNTVTVIDTETGRTVENIWAALYPQSPAGSTPDSLALSPDDKLLFVANANNNTVAVFDVSAPGKSRSLGFIPVGWYPTSVRVTPDGKTLLVASRKGLMSEPNPKGPQPGLRPEEGTTVQYIGRLFRGTLSLVSLKEILHKMRDYTAQAYQCSPLTAEAGVSAHQPENNPIPQQPGGWSPIKYVIYIIKENRTYDQVFGDLPQGNGDPKLCLFPQAATPNHHKLASEFVLLDNFYAEAEVSAQGHEWSMGAYSSDFVEKMWPLDYGHNSSGKFPYPAEGKFSVAYPSAGYLWDRAQAAGITYRSYGEFTVNPNSTNQPVYTNVKTLKGHLDQWYRGFDLGYPDTARANRFIEDLKNFEQAGEMPRLQIVRLGNDHTHGSTAGLPKPMTYLADNDLALGQLVEAVSHSKFWPQTAIFVVEDDSQNGPDHVDAHRTVALVISPFTKRAAVDSTMYSTCSMLRTIELILGLPPMSQFDAAARPMYNSFQPRPDVRPYAAADLKVDWNQRNPVTAWGAQIKHLNFAKADAVDDQLLNEMVWRSVRGNDRVMPAPTRAAFVFAAPREDDD
ncbi:MAG TPA: beta-propeller fold lactonase family protein, partial [Candidatus Acidoferrales bacterium]|nr:beta-propeller fold lactonase family protein [Candidatus Acidoferrales bacterium]